ncbi:glycosyltransferase [Acidisoma sp. C75]
MALESTGERFMPGMEGETAIEHLHRYLIAQELAPGLDVLDIASGEGYGSALLGKCAKSVIGVDISIDAVNHANSAYANDTVRYMVGNCLDIPLPGNSVDLIVSFETLEHVEDHDRLLSEYKRVLRANGRLLISSPDRYLYSVSTGYQNPFHKKELYDYEFRSLIEKYFNFSVFGGQRNMFGSTIGFEDASSSNVSFLREQSRIIKTNGTPKPMYLLALASDKELPPSVSGVLIEPVTSSDAFRSIGQDVLNKDHEIKELRDSCGNLVGKLDHAEEELRLLGKKEQHQSHELSKLRALNLHLEQDLSNKRVENEGLEVRLDREKLARLRLAREAVLSAKQRHSAGETAALDAVVAKLSSIEAAHAQGVEDQENRLRALSEQYEIALGEVARLAQIEQSLTWRVTKPVRTVLSKSPASRRAIRAVARRIRSVMRGTRTVPRSTPPNECDQKHEQFVIENDVSASLQPPSARQSYEDRVLQRLRAAFDVDYYSRQVETMGGFATEDEALSHFLDFGWKMGLDPSPLFSTSYYLQMHADIRNSDENPFVHWVMHGREELRRSIPFQRRVRQGFGAPLVSAIVPNYNHAAFLKKRLDSILSQTYQKIEIIVLDDCSTDGSVEIIAQYVSKHTDKIRFISNAKNSGNVFAQWRKGLSAARGDLFWICESDDFAELDFLEKLVPTFADESVMLSFGKIQLCDVEGTPDFWLDGYRERAQSGIWNAEQIKPAAWWFKNGFSRANVIPNVGGCLIRSQAISDNTWASAEQYKILGDWFLYSELSHGGKIAYSPDAVSYFRQHGNNTSVKSFHTKHYYQEHESLLRHIAQKWGVSDSVLFDFSVNLKEVFDNSRAEREIGPFESVYRKESLERTKRSQRHVLFCVLGFHLGGGELFPILLANELIKQGIMVSFVVFHGEVRDENIRRQLDSRIPVYDFEDIEEYGIWDFVVDAEVDLIHSHFCRYEERFFAEASSRAIVPYIVTLHGSYECIEYPADLLQRIKEQVTQWIYLAPKNLAHLRDPDGSLPQGDLTFIGNGMPLDSRPFPFDRASLGIEADALVAAFASRAIPQKGWDQAIQACLRAGKSLERAVHIILCGTGPEFERLSAYYSDHERVHLMGYQDCIHGLYRLADCIIFPSRFAGESFPLTLVQALQTGTPAIATEIGFVRSMMTGGSDRDEDLAGVLVPPLSDDEGFVDSLAEALISSAEPQKIEFLSRKAAALRHSFDMDAVAAKYISCYRRFC